MKIIFAGTPLFALPTLRMSLQSSHEVCAVYTQPDRPSGRGRKLKPGPVKTLALESGMPVCQPDTFKSPQELRKLATFNADLMVVIAYGMILPRLALDIPRLGCVNVHASLLPRWRGAAPIQRALLAGDEKTGVTIMRMVEKLDAGEMLHKEECKITHKQTASELHDYLAELGAKGLAVVLPQIEADNLNAEPQQDALVTYAEKMEKKEAILDWSQDAMSLARKVRGFNAWPVAQTQYRGKVLRIWRAEALDCPVSEAPGVILTDTNKTFDVATGKGVLRLLEVQLPGGKRLDVQAFLHAHDVAGELLG